MKILQTIPSLSPRLGGPTRAVQGFSRSLQELGVDVHILTTNDDTDRHLDVPLNKLILYKGVPTTFLPRTFRAKEFIYAKDLSRWHRENLKKFDLVHTHYLFSYLPSWTARAARQQHIPYIMRPLGQLTPWALSQSSSKKTLYSSLIERRNLQGAATIHCTSHEETTNVQDFGISAPTIALPLGVTIPKPIEDARYKLHQVYEISGEVPVILFLSRIHHKKQPEVLIDAVADLLIEHPCHVIFAGAGEDYYVEELRSRIKKLNITKNVTFTGFVTGYDKELLLQGADAFALPSHSENFGIAVAEALVSGLPIVITPGIQISAEIENAQAGLVVEATSRAFSTALSQLITQPQLSNQLRKNGLELAKNRYSWAAISKKLFLVYEKILSQKKKYVY